MMWIIYKEPVSFLDAFHLNGLRVARHSLTTCFAQHDLIFKRATFLCIPKLKWSNRDIAGFKEKQTKIIVTGELFFKAKARNFIMVYNLERCEAEAIKILDIAVDITALAYGPYDNGHVLVGLNDG